MERSDQNAQAHCRGDQSAGQSMNCYQSVWMARWTQASCSAAPQVQNDLSLSLMSNFDGDAKKLTEVTDTRTIRIMNEGIALTERLDCQPFPVFNGYQNVGSGIELKNVPENLPHGQVSRPQFDFNIENDGTATVRNFNSVLEMAARASGSREHVFQSERISQYLEEPGTQMILYGSNKGKAPLVSSMVREKEVGPISLGSTSKEYLSNNSIIRTKHEYNPDLQKFSILGRDKYWDDNSTYKKCGKSILKQRTSSLSLLDSSAGNNLLPLFVGESSKKKQNFPCTESFSNRINPVKEKESVNLSNGGCPFPRMPGSVHDVETMGIFTANSMDGLAGGPSKFPQTTHNMLFAKNKDINKSKQNQGIRESSNSMKSNRNTCGQLLCLSPPLCLNQKGVKIQLLDSSSGSLGKGDFQEILSPDVCERNESSAETAIMDMETLRERNYLSGVNSTSSNKNLSLGHDTPSQATTGSVREEIECKQGTIALPDINEVPVQASSNPMDNAEPSTSRTQSLDAGLLSYGEQPINHKTSGCAKCPVRSEPSSRWLKRLKLSASHSFGVGSESSNVEPLSHLKVNKLFRKVIEGKKTGISDQGFHKFGGKEQNTSNEPAILIHKAESSSVYSRKKDLDLLLSHSWIQRWCRAANQEKKLEGVVVCEPQSTKMDFDELQNEQFPSIGAMALMGKAMTGFQPCEFRKRGSLTLWDTKSL